MGFKNKILENIMEKDFNDIGFTYYGDLLGISNLYLLDESLASKKLGQFYDLVWNHYKSLAENDRYDFNFYLFSDSLFITGKQFETILIQTGYLYNKLISNDIFIKGAFVSGKLEYDPRLELKNFKKNLPTTDVLFRAINLEKDVKGMRLVLENKLAKKILPKEWLCEHLYRKNQKDRNFNIRYDNFLRRIVVNKNGYFYEYLWPFMKTMTEFDSLTAYDYLADPTSFLDYKMRFVPDKAKCHIIETKEVYELAQYREDLNRIGMTLLERKEIYGENKQ